MLIIIQDPPGQVTSEYHIASPEELAEHWDYVARSDRLEAMRPELLQKYPNKHVALTENGVFVVADSAAEAAEKILELGERPGFAARDFLKTPNARYNNGATSATANKEGGRPMVIISHDPPGKVTSEYHIASPEELAEHWDYVARSDRLAAMRPELLQKYPDKYVALTENGVFVVADSAAERAAKILELGERPGFAARDFLNTKPRSVVIL